MKKYVRTKYENFILITDALMWKGVNNMFWRGKNLAKVNAF